jgi:hypothetical protein
MTPPKGYLKTHPAQPSQAVATGGVEPSIPAVGPLDHRLLPHIFESILHALSATELLRLRVLSNDIRDYIEQMLASLVVITDIEAGAPFHSVLGHVLPSPGPARCLMQAHTKALDFPDIHPIHPQPPIRWVACDTRIDFLRQLQPVVRRHHPSFPAAFADQRLEGSTLVDFGHGPIPAGFERYVRPVRDVSAGSGELVLEFVGYPEVVLILDEGIRVDPADIATSLCIRRMCGCMLNDWEGPCLAFSSFAPLKLNITLVVGGYIPQTYVVAVDYAAIQYGELAKFAAGEQINVTVMSHVEYSKVVGRRQYELETVRNTSSLVPLYRPS